MFLRDPLKGNLCYIFSVIPFFSSFLSRLSAIPHDSCPTKQAAIFSQSPWLEFFLSHFLPTTHTLFPSTGLLFSSSFLLRPPFTLSLTLALVLSPRYCSSPGIFPLFFLYYPISLFLCFDAFFLTFILKILFVVFISWGNYVIHSFGPFLFVSLYVWNFLKCLHQGQLLILSLFVPVWPPDCVALFQEELRELREQPIDPQAEQEIIDSIEEVYFSNDSFDMVQHELEVRYSLYEWAHVID